MNAATDDAAAFANGFERGRNEFASGREDDRGVQFLWWHAIGVAHPRGAEACRKCLRLLVTFPGKRVELAVLLPRDDLGDDVSRRAESVDADPTRILTAEPQTAVTDEAGTEQWCGRKIGKLGFAGEGKAVSRIGGDKLCIATVNRVAGELGGVTEVFPSSSAVITSRARWFRPPVAIRA